VSKSGYMANAPQPVPSDLGGPVAYGPGFKWPRFSLASLFLLTGFVCFGATCIQYFNRRVEVFDADYEVAYRKALYIGATFTFPSDARHINLRGGFERTVDTDFDITESDFREWAKERGWSLNEVSGQPAGRGLSNLPPPRDNWPYGWPRGVNRSLDFSNASHDGGWTLIFDLDREHAYVTYSPR